MLNDSHEQSTTQSVTEESSRHLLGNEISNVALAVLAMLQMECSNANFKNNNTHD